MKKKVKKKSYILVTGGAGYIGSIFTALLINESYNVIVVDDLSTGSKKLINKKSKFFKIDLKNLKLLKKKLNPYSIKATFHFAASLSVPESQKNPLKYYMNNVIGTENLIKFSVMKKIKKFIFSSTCAVYGSPANVKINEEALTLPQSNYGKTKLMAEKMLINYSKKFKFKYAILRYFNVIGADIKNNLGQINGNSLFKELTRNIIKKNYSINLFGTSYHTKDGTCIRDYIDVNDLCDLHLLSYKRLYNKNSFILNCGYNKGYSVKEVIMKFSKFVNKNIKIKIKPKRPGDVEAIYCNNKKIKIYFPKWKKNFDLKESIKNMIKWESYLHSKH